MIGRNGARSAQVRARALGTSAMTLAAMLAGPAFAQCAPEPTVANGTTTCRGTDADGLRVTTFGTRVTVEQGATVHGAGAPAVAVRIGSGDGFGAPVTLSVAGLVDGGTDAGVSLLAQPIPNNFSNQTLALTVAAGGRVTGISGVVVSRAAGVQTFLTTSASIDNSGSIVGTGSVALLSTDANSGFSSITNRLGGTIGAIIGPVGALANAGTINGGTRSAIDWNGGTGFFGDLGNTGTIASTSTGATLANIANFRILTNSGTIENRGTGAALATTGGLTVTNAATGRITSTGATAISAGDTLQLTNAGTIVGDVAAGGSSTFSGSTIDTSAGRITGSLRLGAGADTLVGLYDGTRLQYGVSGLIDGGAGTDTVRARFAADATLAAPLVLPTSFERLSLNLDAGVTATLGAGFVAPGTLLVSGAGTLVNRTALTGTGQVLISDFQAGGTPSIVNAGTIASTLNSSGTFAVQLSSFNRFENSGTITATRDAVTLSGQGPVVNSGTITAGGTALSVSSAPFTNTVNGTIRSTGGTGLILFASFGTAQSNAGRIEGATAGVQLNSTLTNTGTITATQTGVLLNANATLDNRAGGTVSGNGNAISAQFPNSTFFNFNSIVANAGTITGNVLLGGSQSTSTNNNRFFALPGGVLNGNLALGQGDLLVTELVNSGPGAFAGITGTVSASNALLRLRVRQDTTAAIANLAGFAGVGYELYNNAALTLTGTAGARPLLLAGRGSVDLTADIAATTEPAIQSTGVTIAAGETATATALTITSRGTLGVTRTNANTFPGATVALGGSDSFTNAGTIVATDRATPTFSQFAAITGGFSSTPNGGTAVTNTGTITLDGTIGLSGVRTIVNNGSIVQAAGGRAATGIGAGNSVPVTLTNTGTIDVAGIAVQGDFSPLTITNSGRIASSGDAAIVVSSGFSLLIDNAAAGTIAGSSTGVVIRTGGGMLTNAGTITGTVDLGFATNGRSSAPGTYIADGGTIAGDLLFGSGRDNLVTFGALGVSGRIDGGQGIDTLIQARRASDTATLGLAGVVNFEQQGVRAIGADTVVTTRADAPIDGGFSLSGDGAIVNTATVTGQVFIDNQGSFANGMFQPGPVLAGFTNQGEIRGGFFGETPRFTNSGMIGTETLAHTAVSVDAAGSLAFSNSGTIANDGSERAVSLEAYQGRELVTTNSGTIKGGVEAYLSNYVFPTTDTPSLSLSPASVSFTNGGTVTATGARGGTVRLTAELYSGTAGTVTLANTGTIEAIGRSGIAAGLGIRSFTTTGDNRLVVTNAGTIRANAGGFKDPATDPYAGASTAYPRTHPATALVLGAGPTGRAEVTNAAGGTMEATGGQSVALSIVSGTLDLANAGTIRGGAGTVLTADDRLGDVFGRPYLAGAIQSGIADDRVVNTGTIIGSVDLGRGADRIDNLGRIEADVFLGMGNDTFLQRASATLIGTVDAGDGDDLFIVDATGGGAVNGDQFVNFERFNQIGEGNVAYSGNFRFNSVGVAGGTVTVGTGQTLSSSGPVTITGSDAAETVVNDGTIVGGVSLLSGDDRVVNRGTIGGAVLLGDGDDSYVEAPGSRAESGVDGGLGVDTYTALLVGGRQGLGPRTGFERLTVEGTGTLGLTLDQGFETVGLVGTGLNVALNGFTVGSMTGGDAAEQFTVDGDVASVALGAGDDLLSLGTTRAAGLYDGGKGSDTLRFTATAPVTLAGTATGFEQVTLAGNALTVTGTLGSTGATIGFGESAQALTVAAGGTLAGTIDLGAGNDTLRLGVGSVVAGTVSGGAGTDGATIELAGDRTLGAGTLTEFETLASEGRGVLTLTGAQAFDRVTVATDLAVASGASLTAGQVAFGAGDQRFTIAGEFAGGVDGGAGSDTIAVSGGSAATPIAFTDIAGIESFAMAAGFVTVSGTAAFGAVDLSDGRLLGLAGSTINAGQIAVRSGATFGSSGTVNGNLAVSGILSPGGASIATMTVNGNVALASGSLTVFDLAPTAQDRLAVNGAVQIAPGATLQLVPTGTIRPGTSYDLITASDGITGSFSTVAKPDSLFGFVVQRADRIQLLGQFLADAGASPQVARSIAFANSVLVQQPANSPLFAALPALLGANGASNARAFAQLTPEPYASATQVGVENALALADVARGPGFAANRTEPGGFTFGQAVGSWYRLAADPAEGVSQARTTSYGFLGGIGYGDRAWAVGAFGGYLDSRQRIDALGARTGVDGWVAGVHGRYEAAGFGFGASLSYNDGRADTRRALPGASGATGRYDLDSWVSDVSAHYTLDTGEWALRPRVGLTYVRTTRERAVEVGGSFALTVARDRHIAGFADAGIGFARSEASAGALRPFVALGVRYQLEGRRADALAGYAGSPLGLTAIGASRTRAVGVANAGIGYRLTTGLELFSTVSAQTGENDHRQAISTGVRLRF